MTAVEWLQEKFNENNAKFINWSEDYFHEAKEMEKQQIFEAWDNGFDNGLYQGKYNENCEINCGEQYYNKTFNK